MQLIRSIVGDTADDTYLRGLINDNGGDLERALDSLHLKKPGINEQRREADLGAQRSGGD